MQHILTLPTPIQIRYTPAPIIPAGSRKFGSILASCLTQCDLSEIFPQFRPMVVSEHYTRPLYSPEHLQRTHLTLIQSDLYCHAIQKAFATPSWQFGADQSVPAHRMSSMNARTAKALGLMPFECGNSTPTTPHRSLSQPKTLVARANTPLCTITSEVKQRAEVQPSRCPHDVLCKPGETHSLICQACRYGFAPWEESRTTIELTPARLNNVDDADLLSGDADLDACIADDTSQPATRFVTPTKKQSAEWNKVFRDAKLPAVSRDRNTVSLMVEADTVSLRDHVAARYAEPRPKRNYHDRNEAQIFEAKQQWKQVGVEVGPRCLRCDAPLGKRKGTNYCSDNCRKRHHEEQGQRQC